MEMDFTGKVALITGAGNGIGRATAVAFAKSGAKVVVVDRDTAGGEATVGIIRQQGGDATFVAADVTKSDDVKNYVKTTIDTYGRIDCFFNNAGIEGKWAHTAEYDEDTFDAVIGVNVKGVFLDMHVLNKPEVLIGQAQSKFDTGGNLTDEVARNLIRDLMNNLGNWARQLAHKP